MAEFRLPKPYRFNGSEVVVNNFGNDVLQLPMDDPWPMLEAGLERFEPGLTINREQPEPQNGDVIQNFSDSLP